MQLDSPWIINLLTLVLVGGLGWFCNQIWSALQRMQEDVKKFELRISDTYVKQERLDKLFDPVMRKLERIEQALYQKQDRGNGE